jgi:hypothetical protein
MVDWLQILILHRHKALQAIAGKRGTTKMANQRKLFLLAALIGEVYCPGVPVAFHQWRRHSRPMTLNKVSD